jgi:hypothetical protein
VALLLARSLIGSPMTRLRNGKTCAPRQLGRFFFTVSRNSVLPRRHAMFRAHAAARSSINLMVSVRRHEGAGASAVAGDRRT